MIAQVDPTRRGDADAIAIATALATASRAANEGDITWNRQIDKRVELLKEKKKKALGDRVPSDSTWPLLGLIYTNRVTVTVTTKKVPGDQRLSNFKLQSPWPPKFDQFKPISGVVDVLSAGSRAGGNTEGKGGGGGGWEEEGLSSQQESEYEGKSYRKSVSRVIRTPAA